MKQTADWLNVALSQQTQVEYKWRGDMSFDMMLEDDVLPGDIVMVGDMDSTGPKRMIMVLSVEPERRCFFGALVINELSLATADALILEPEETDLPYRIAVLADLAAHFWFVQVDQRLGAVNEKILNSIIDVYAGGDNEFQYSRRGVPLQYPRWDLRWPKLGAEAEILRKLEWDCINNRENPYIDLPYIYPIPLDNHVTEEFLSENYKKLEGRTRGFSPSCLTVYINSLDRFLLRAYPALFSPKSSNNGLATKRANEQQKDWLLRSTKEDGWQNAPFVIIVGSYTPSYERLLYKGKRVECIYEPVGV